MLTKLYNKSEIWFFALWTAIYIVGESLAQNLSRTIGVEDSAALVLNLILSAVLYGWIRNNGLLEKYGLCRPNIPAKTVLYYIPLVILCTHNLWGGLVVNLPLLDTVCHVGSMLCVGFLEEVIFRGLLFRAMEKDGVRSAILVSSVTFGLGHIANLFNGSGMTLASNFVQVFGAIGIGFLFVVIFFRGGSLVPCILAHGIYNSLSAFGNGAAFTVPFHIAVNAVQFVLVVLYGLYILKKPKETPMPNIIEITDLSAPELDVFARLTEAQLRNRRQPEKGLFIAESLKVIGHALDAGYQPVSFLMEARHIEGGARDILARCGDVPVYTAGRDLLAQLTGYELTRGVLCAMRRPKLKTVEELCAKARRVAVLEGIVDATNIGAIFRSAAALHVDAVLLTPSCCDPLNRRAVRVSMGTVFQVPWTRIGDDPSQWPQPGLARLKELGFRTAAMALSDDSVSVDDPRLMAEDKLAIVLGTEGDGLAPRTIADCDYTVCIPMSHGVDSLNVAAASAVAFWQLRAR